MDRSGFVVLAARAAIAMVVIVGSASETAGQSGNPSDFSKETFTYKTVGSTAIRADVYRLAGQDLRPCIVWIHGGALIFGSRAMLPADERERFLRAGYVVVAIDYRLAPETKLPQILEDIEDAHRWVRDRGPALFRIDPRRVADVGQSAGAYLALMAGVRVRPSLRAVVSFYGYGDIAGKWYSRPDAFYLRRPRVTKEHAYGVVGRQVLSESAPVPRSDFYDYCRQNGLWPQEVAGLDPDAGPAKFEPYTPERLVTPAYPPTLLLHGDRDTDVPFGMSQRMAAVFKRQRVEHRLYRMKGFNHLFDVFPDGLPPEGRPTGLGNPQVSLAFDVVMDFLARHVAP
jgi:acetyl esterase/lipase